MVCFRTAAAVAAAITAVFVGDANAEGTDTGPADARRSCAQPAPDRAGAGAASGSTWSLENGGVQVRIAVGKNAVTVNNSGGVVMGPQAPACPGGGRD